MSVMFVGAEVSSLLAFVALAGLVGIAAGIVLIIRPDWLAQFGGRANRWISTRNLDRGLDRTVWLDKWFYQHHQVSGMLMLAGACWIIVFLVSAVDRSRMLAMFARIGDMSPTLTAGLLDGFVLLALAGSVFAALVSLFLLLRPSLLRDFEQGVNRWVSTRRAMYPLEVTRLEFDRYVLRHYRQFGMFLLFGGLTLLGLIVLWLR